MKSVGEIGDFLAGIDTTAIGITDEDVARPVLIVDRRFTLCELTCKIVI